MNTGKKTISMRQYLKAAKEQSGGHGLFCHECRRPEFWINADGDAHDLAKAVDEVAVELANKLGWSLKKLAEFSNSVAGRHTGDSFDPSKVTTDRKFCVEAVLRRGFEWFEKA